MVMSNVWNLLETEYTEQVSFLRENGFLGEDEKGNVEILLNRLEIACLDGDRIKTDLMEMKATCHALRKAIHRAALLDESLWQSPDQAILKPKLTNHIRLVSRLAGLHSA